MNDTNTTQQTEFVLRRIEDSLRLGGQEYDGKWWFFILIPILVIGVGYVIWQYTRDGKSVGWPWATLLALLRCTVYAVLAAEFLLPALQSWHETKTQSRVLVLSAVSGTT